MVARAAAGSSGSHAGRDGTSGRHSRRVTRSMTSAAPNSEVKKASRAVEVAARKNGMGAHRRDGRPLKSGRKGAAKAKPSILDPDGLVQEQLPSPSSSSSPPPQTAIDSLFEYSDSPISGVTSMAKGTAVGGAAGLGRYRVLRTEYRVPVMPGGRRKRAVPEDDDDGDVVVPVELIQCRISHSLYALVVQAVLWNQTSGRQARPVLDELLATYPDPAALARADVGDLAAMLRPIGLYNSRARRLLGMAAAWLARPPVPGRGYARMRDRKYTAVPLLPDDGGDPDQTHDVDYDKGKKEDMGDDGAAPPELAAAIAASSNGWWEIAHLPGVGPYALDSFRIFHRDEMRGLAADWLGGGRDVDTFEPEWKRVVPGDKDLRAYLRYRWALEGWDWDPLTGKRKRRKRST